MPLRHWTIRSLAFSACVAAGAVAASPDPAAVETQAARAAIPIMTQQLMDAIPANPEIWRRYLSERAVYVAETGDITSKTELLEELKPFPSGLSGSIEVRNLHLTEYGDMTISTFDAFERETVYDQKIEVDYVVTHVWRRESGRWRLAASHTMVRAKDPVALPVDTTRWSDFTGVYELSGKRRYNVELQAGTLLGGPEGGKLAPLIPVGENVFAESGSSLGNLRIFLRSPGGAVERMVSRRKFADLELRRVGGAGPAPAPAAK